MFAKFFKPRWQHRKAAVRVKAIQRLSPDNAEHLEILSQLARQDQSTEVRRAAVERLAIPELLTEILELDSDPAIRHSAAQRICKIILDTRLDAELRITCLRHLQDDNMLAHIALNSDDQRIQLQAVASIEDQQCLTTLTIKGSNTQLRQNAAERLELPELLNQASRAIKGKDKSVFRIIRNKQQQLHEQARLTEQQLQRQQALLSSLQQLAASEFFPQYTAKFEALQQQLSDGLLAELQEAFDSACERCLAVIAAEQQKAETLEQQKQQQADQQRVQEQLLAQMDSTVQRCAALFSSDHFNALDFDAEQQHWQGLLQQWQELPAALQHQAEQLIGQQTQFLEAAQRWFQHQPAIPELLAQADAVDEHNCRALLKEAQTLQRAIQWPAPLRQPQELAELQQTITLLEQQRAAQQQQSRSESDNLSQLLSQLEIRLQSGEIKQASQLEQQIADVLQTMNGSTPGALQQQYRGLHAQLQEMLDWQGYAVVPKKEQLCEAMESLINSTLEAPELARRIKALQKQWRTLDASDPYHSHTLWQRFKDASDNAYKPCEAYFAEQKQQREQNLAQRKQLAAELEQFLATVDWQQPDWPAIEQYSRTAKQQWKLFAPVDRTPGKAVQSQFNALLKQLDGQIKQRREQVAGIKQSILADVRALLDNISSMDSDQVQQAAETTKQLQQQWKQAGSTFHATERTLWPEFRETCNQIFTALNQQRQTQRHQHNRQQQELEQFLASDHYSALLRRINLCDQMETMLMDGTLDQLALDEFQSAWAQGEYPAAPYNELIDSRYQHLLDLIAGRIEMEQLTVITDQALRQLCIRLEIVLGAESPEQDEALRMEYQMQRLQSALQQQQQNATLLEMKQLELEWQCQPFAKHHDLLQLRFYSQLQPD